MSEKLPINSKFNGLTVYPVPNYDSSYIRLDRNENYCIPKEYISYLVEKAVKDVDLRLYPSIDLLIREISSRFAYDEKYIAVANGGDDILYKISLAMLRSGGDAIITPPTYSMYRWIIERCGGDVKEVLLKGDFSLDVEGILESYNDRTKLILISNPNNPTGNLFRKNSIVKLLENVDALVVIDEAYGEFSGESSIDLLSRGFENLVIVKTFSKLGFAGVRLGYALGRGKLMEYIKKYIPPYNINSFSIQAGVYIIREYDRIMFYIEKCIEERTFMLESLKEMEGFIAYPSKTNFILVRSLVQPVNTIIKGLLRHKIVVKDLSSQPLLENCFRVTVGDRDMNRQFLTIFKKIMGGDGT